MEHPTSSWWFLGLSLFWGLTAANAIRPLYRPALLSGISFFAGWLFADLPLHHLVIQAALTAGLIAAGAMQTWLGWLALALTALAWIGLGWCAFQGLRTGRFLRRAMDPHLPACGSPSEPPVWTNLIPIPMRPAGVEKIRDLVYSSPNGVPLSLDLYRHRSQPVGCPTLLELHGGGWVIGTKREQGLPLMHHMANRGWVCVSADYRLSPNATFPDALIDAKRALAWIRQHGVEFGADPGFVVVTGGSAGAHLASLLALTPDRPDLQPGFEQVDTRVEACVAIYGVFDLLDEAGQGNPGLKRLVERALIKARRDQDRQRFMEASPIHQLHRSAPPFLVLHGQLDNLSPVEGARRFAAEYRRLVSDQLIYAELPGAHHAFDIFHCPRANAAVGAVARYLEAQVRSRQAGRD